MKLFELIRSISLPTRAFLGALDSLGLLIGAVLPTTSAVHVLTRPPFFLGLFWLGIHAARILEDKIRRTSDDEIRDRAQGFFLGPAMEPALVATFASALSGFFQMKTLSSN